MFRLPETTVQAEVPLLPVLHRHSACIPAQMRSFPVHPFRVQPVPEQAVINQVKSRVRWGHRRSITIVVSARPALITMGQMVGRVLIISPVSNKENEKCQTATAPRQKSAKQGQRNADRTLVQYAGRRIKDQEQ